MIAAPRRLDKAVNGGENDPGSPTCRIQQTLVCTSIVSEELAEPPSRGDISLFNGPFNFPPSALTISPGHFDSVTHTAAKW